jgi:hypothetical protein
MPTNGLLFLFLISSLDSHSQTFKPPEFYTETVGYVDRKKNYKSCKLGIELYRIRRDSKVSSEEELESMRHEDYWAPEVFLRKGSSPPKVIGKGYALYASADCKYFLISGDKLLQVFDIAGKKLAEFSGESALWSDDSRLLYYLDTSQVHPVGETRMAKGPVTLNAWHAVSKKSETLFKVSDYAICEAWCNYTALEPLGENKVRWTYPLGWGPNTNKQPDPTCITHALVVDVKSKRGELEKKNELICHYEDAL